MEPELTKENVKDYLEGLGLDDNILAPLVNQLNKGRNTLEAWTEMTEGQWKEFYGLAGIQIYNYLHPRSEGIDYL